MPFHKHEQTMYSFEQLQYAGHSFTSLLRLPTQNITYLRHWEYIRDPFNMKEMGTLNFRAHSLLIFIKFLVFTWPFRAIGQRLATTSTFK